MQPIRYLRGKLRMEESKKHFSRIGAVYYSNRQVSMSRTEIDEQLRCAKSVVSPDLLLFARHVAVDMLCEESDNALGKIIASLIIHCQSSSRLKIVEECPVAWGLLNRA